MATQNPLAPIPHPPGKAIVGSLPAPNVAAPLQDRTRLAREHGPVHRLVEPGRRFRTRARTIHPGGRPR